MFAPIKDFVYDLGVTMFHYFLSRDLAISAPAVILILIIIINCFFNVDIVKKLQILYY